MELTPLFPIFDLRVIICPDQDLVWVEDHWLFWVPFSPGERPHGGGGSNLALSARCSEGVRCCLGGAGPRTTFHLFHSLGEGLNLTVDGGEL